MGESEGIVMALKAEDLITYLQKHPEAMIRFEEDRYYGNQCTVSITDFEYDAEQGIFMLPNLCLCYPEPD